MSLVPPLARNEPPRLTPAETHYGNSVLFQAPCPCGEGNVWWKAERADTALAKPVYDITCKHPQEENAA